MPKTKDQCFGVAARLYCDDEFSDVEVDMDVVHRVTDILYATANDQPLPVMDTATAEALPPKRDKWFYIIGFTLWFITGLLAVAAVSNLVS